MTTRCDPSSAVDFLRQTWSTYLDPTKTPPEERPYGSKAIINTCKEYKYLKSFSKRTMLRQSTYEQIKGKRSKFSLSFDIPMLTLFEPEV